jgi:hypothetical protein
MELKNRDAAMGRLGNVLIIGSIVVFLLVCGDIRITNSLAPSDGQIWVVLAFVIMLSLAAILIGKKWVKVVGSVLICVSLVFAIKDYLNGQRYRDGLKQKSTLNDKIPKDR